MVFKKGHTINVGRKLSEETKDKISEKAKERFKDKRNHPWFNRPVSDEHKKKLSIAHTGKHAYLPTSGTPFEKGHIPWIKGRHHSDESKIKMSEARIGTTLTDEQKKRVGDFHRGRKRKPFTDAHKKAISDGKKGTVPWNKGKSHMQKEDHPLWGTTRSNETKKRISDANKGRKGLSGEDNPSWLGGLSFEPYCYKFNERLKESIRDRDHRVCQLCGKTEADNDKKLSVHHIHYDKKNCEPDLIALCTSCNVKVNHNREYYENLFMDNLYRRELIIESMNNTPLLAGVL